MRVTIATITLAAAFALGAACGGKSHPNVAPQPTGKLANDAELAVGRRVFVANCQRCHGARGDGQSAPRIAGVVTSTYPNIQNEINFVTNGFGGMPAWKDTLSAAEIKAVVRYTREVL